LTKISDYRKKLICDVDRILGVKLLKLIMKYRSMETRNQEQQHVVRRPAFDTKAVNS
jgi:hypothetical protein